jgi:hypothetical protein
VCFRGLATNNVQRLRQLEAENARLKKLAPERDPGDEGIRRKNC